MWYLVPDETNGDGEIRSYLDKPARYRPCDEALFDAMSGLQAAPRSVAKVRSTGMLGMDAAFFEGSLQGHEGRGQAACEIRRAHRATWLADALRAVDGCDVVFLDPDNGVGGASHRPHGRKGHKHATLDEIVAFADGGRRSVVVYHHTGRTGGTAADQARTLASRVCALLPYSAVGAIGFKRGTHRIFLLACRRELAAAMSGRIDELIASWRGHFEKLVPLLSDTEVPDGDGLAAKRSHP